MTTDLQTRPADDLPEFQRPPVTEVVLGIQFNPLVDVYAAHLGAIWGLFRADFPTTVDQPPLATVFERFDAPSEGGSLDLNLSVLRQPLPRCWFINPSQDEVLQFQQDRFHHNWRRREGGSEYPRYARIRSKFEAEARALSKFLRDSELGGLEVNQCEVTYINHIIADENWSEHGQVGRVIRLLARDGVVPLGVQERVHYEAAYLLRNEGNEPAGRLHVSVASGISKRVNRPMFALTLTARGAPSGPGIDGALEFLDFGRRQIVRSFAAMTTEAMHAQWGRTR